jgi:hypothetical protein
MNESSINLLTMTNVDPPFAFPLRIPGAFLVIVFINVLEVMFYLDHLCLNGWCFNSKGQTVFPQGKTQQTTRCAIR